MLDEDSMAGLVVWRKISYFYQDIYFTTKVHMQRCIKNSVFELVKFPTEVHMCLQKKYANIYTGTQATKNLL